MATALSLTSSSTLPSALLYPATLTSSPLLNSPKNLIFHNRRFSPSFTLEDKNKAQHNLSPISNNIEPDPDEEEAQVEDVGVRAALSVLMFYKREISPLLPKSCRYVPTCSEYSMIAYKKYGVAKGTLLTAWRICRCNPLGGSGFDPPRWFGEERPPEEKSSSFPQLPNEIIEGKIKGKASAEVLNCEAHVQKSTDRQLDSIL